MTKIRFKNKRTKLTMQITRKRHPMFSIKEHPSTPIEFIQKKYQTAKNALYIYLYSGTKTPKNIDSVNWTIE